MKKNISLRTKIVFLLLATCGVFISGSYIFSENFLRAGQEQALITLRLSAESLAEQSRMVIENFAHTIEVAANQARFAEKRKDASQEFLNRLVAENTWFTFAFLFDTTGKLIAVNDMDHDKRKLNVQDFYDRNWSNQEWFKSAGSQTSLFGPIVVDAFDKVYGKKSLSLLLSTPVSNGKGTSEAGVLVIVAKFDSIEREFMEVWKELDSLSLGTAELTLMNSKGQILIDYDPSLKSKNPEVFHDFENVILKFNLVEKGVEAAKIVTEKRIPGSMFSMHARKGLVQAVGYSPIKGDPIADQTGWSVLVRINDREALSDLYTAKSTFLFVSGLIVLIVLAFGVAFAMYLSRSITHVSDRLAKNVGHLVEASQQIAASSTELSEAASEQAASLQETVASVDQINAMIEKNADAAAKSSEASMRSKTSAEDGKNRIEEMLKAIEAISASTDEMSEQMNQSTKEFSEVTKIIKNIGEKTKVINDIVFQTKLLSFNASVEAARAGEHGRGFAVVAEEVGNLAQMSGKASKEISVLLEESTFKVDSIVKNTQDKVQRMVRQNKDKVALGSQVARSSNESLDSILENVGRASEMVSEIALASKEQSFGVQEVTKAMAQLDKVTQQNSIVAQQSADSAESLRAQSTELQQAIDQLEKIVKGEGSGISAVSVRLPQLSVATPNKSGQISSEDQGIKSSVQNESHKSTKVASLEEAVPSSSDSRFED